MCNTKNLIGVVNGETRYVDCESAVRCAVENPGMVTRFVSQCGGSYQCIVTKFKGFGEGHGKVFTRESFMYDGVGLVYVTRNENDEITKVDVVCSCYTLGDRRAIANYLKARFVGITAFICDEFEKNYKCSKQRGTMYNPLLLTWDFDQECWIDKK